MTELQKFPFYYPVTVKFSEVDLLGVCNNAVYLNYFEDARLQYLKAANALPPAGAFTDNAHYFVVRNELNYRSHARYDDELRVYTRISFIKNSSYGFEHIIVNAADNRVVVEGSGVIVHADAETKKSSPLPERFLVTIRAFQPDVVYTGDRQ